jgi:UDP-hydrolysing UDP-N-acetyl-D-glucosamine 2-epimerase
MTARPRRIAIVTGTRADYGLLSHLIRPLSQLSGVALSIIVTGTHLDEKFGMTVNEIERDGFTVAARVPMPLAGDQPRDMAMAMAMVTSGMTMAMTMELPELVVVLGDRYEILATVVAATALGIPVAHIHGGEITEGAVDDSIRHAVTKLSHVHFVSAPDYGRRVIQMGEQPDRVFVEGALGVDAVAGVKLLDRDEIARRLGIQLGRPLLLVTYHPVTIEGAAGGAGVEPLVAALEQVAGATIVMTGVNADPAHLGIEQRLQAFAAAHPERVVLRASLGQQLYLSVMAIADAVVGNSSSGVIEAPVMRVPTVNVGDRQKGRLMAQSVMSCEPASAAIAAALRQVLAPGFRDSHCTGADFGRPGVGGRIAARLATIPLAGLTRKRFYDL